MSQYETLIGELSAMQADTETMTKAIPADAGKDDKNIQAAAKNGGGENDEDEEGERDEKGNLIDQATAGIDGPDKGKAAGGDASMTKSITAVVDGKPEEMIDATEILKSLDNSILDLQSENKDMAKAFGESVTLTKSLISVVKSQGELIKSLNAKVEEISGQGRGRKTVISVNARPDPMAKALEGQQAKKTVTYGEVMEKCLAAQAAGKLTVMDVARAESSINERQPIPQEILKALDLA